MHKLMRDANCVRLYLLSESFFIVRNMKDVNITKNKTIQIKPYTICSSYQLRLEVERPELRTIFSFLATLLKTKNNFSVYAIFLGSIYTPESLFMKLPNRV